MAKSGNVLNTISSLYHSLTSQRKKLLIRFYVRPIWCLNVPFQKSLNIWKLEKLRSSVFVEPLVFKGFSDFKLELSIELATKDNNDETVLETEIMPSDDSLTIAQKLQTAVSNVMEETVNLLD